LSRAEVAALRDPNPGHQYDNTEATRPLLKQIESLSAQKAARESAQQVAERKLNMRIKELEDALAFAHEAERKAKRRVSSAEAAAAASKEAASSAVQASAELKSKLDAEWKRANSLQAGVSCQSP